MPPAPNGAPRTPARNPPEGGAGFLAGTEGGAVDLGYSGGAGPCAEGEVEGALVGVGGGGVGDGEVGAGTAEAGKAAPGAAGAVGKDCRGGGDAAAAPAAEAEAGGVAGLEAVGVVSLGSSCCSEIASTPSLTSCTPCPSVTTGGGSF